MDPRVIVPQLEDYPIREIWHNGLVLKEINSCCSAPWRSGFSCPIQVWRSDCLTQVRDAYTIKLADCFVNVISKPLVYYKEITSPFIGTIKVLHWYKAATGITLGRLGAPKVEPRRCQNNAWPAAATNRERGLVEPMDVKRNSRDSYSYSKLFNLENVFGYSNRMFRVETRISNRMFRVAIGIMFGYSNSMFRVETRIMFGSNVSYITWNWASCTESKGV
ncbi:hypothetical protein LguiA_014392 [Lonicera macranthoides]